MFRRPVETLNFYPAAESTCAIEETIDLISRVPCLTEPDILVPYCHGYCGLVCVMVWLPCGRTELSHLPFFLRLFRRGDITGGPIRVDGGTSESRNGCVVTRLSRKSAKVDDVVFVLFSQA